MAVIIDRIFTCTVEQEDNRRARQDHRTELGSGKVKKLWAEKEEER